MSGDTLKSIGYLLATIVTLAIEYELCAYLGGYFQWALRRYSVLGTLAYLPFICAARWPALFGEDSR